MVNGLVPTDTWQRLTALEPLHPGLDTVKPSRQVPPVDDAVVDATIPKCLRDVQAMIRIQRLTGMRPGEVCRMRKADIQEYDGIHLYVPPKHKTQRFGKARIVAIGPRAWEVLEEWYLRADPAIPIFGRTRDAYYQAVRAAALRAGVDPWAPNQLRHNVSSEVTSVHGVEAEAAYLGHDANIGQRVYAARDIRTAVMVAKSMG